MTTAENWMKESVLRMLDKLDEVKLRYIFRILLHMTKETSVNEITTPHRGPKGPQFFDRVELKLNYSQFPKK